MRAGAGTPRNLVREAPPPPPPPPPGRENFRPRAHSLDCRVILETEAPSPRPVERRAPRPEKKFLFAAPAVPIPGFDRRA